MTDPQAEPVSENPQKDAVVAFAKSLAAAETALLDADADLASVAAVGSIALHFASRMVAMMSTFARHSIAGNAGAVRALDRAAKDGSTISKQVGGLANGAIKWSSFVDIDASMEARRLVTTALEECGWVRRIITAGSMGQAAGTASAMRSTKR